MIRQLLLTLFIGGSLLVSVQAQTDQFEGEVTRTFHNLDESVVNEQHHDDLLEAEYLTEYYFENTIDEYGAFYYEDDSRYL